MSVYEKSKKFLARNPRRQALVFHMVNPLFHYVTVTQLNRRNVFIESFCYTLKNYDLCYMFEPSLIINRKLSVRVDRIKYFLAICFQLSY